MDAETLAGADKEPKERAGIWTLLNSQFGLWILSTVLVGLISFLYSSFQESNRVYSADMHRITILRDEVAYRLELLDQQVGATLTFSDFAKDVNPWGLKDPTGIYPELQNRSVRGMIVELEELTRRYQKNALPTVDHLENILKLIEKLEFLQIGYTRFINKNSTLASHRNPFPDLQCEIIKDEGEFEAVDFTPDRMAVVGTLRQAIAPVSSAAIRHGRHCN